MAYPVLPQDRFDELKRIVHQPSVFEGFTDSRRDIPAHMTIAEFMTIDDSLRICADLVDGAPCASFWCDRLEHVVSDATFRCQRRGTFLLGTVR